MKSMGKGDTAYVYKDGTPVPQGYCILPDHYVTTVNVVIRSSTPLGIETLRDHLQAKHEVIGIIAKETVCVVQNSKHEA